MDVAGEKATVRYVGSVPEWPGVVAYGVEWDDPSRGKHSGTLNGISYFQTGIANAGSFIKLTNKKISDRLSFDLALAIYTEHHSMESIQWSEQKRTENVGWDKHNRHTSSFASLELILLDNRGIYTCVTGHSFARLKSLDISSNVFTQFDFGLLSAMPQLERLNLNGNRIDKVVGTLVFPLVKSVHLAATRLPWPLVIAIAGQFPALEQLVALFNNYTSADITPFEGVATVDLSHNLLTSLPPVKCTNLVVSHNHIDAVTVPYHFHYVDLRHNHISRWAEVDNLLGITGIKINHNPVVDSLAVDDQMNQLIARLGCPHINGVVINDPEPGELWFISQVKLGKIQFSGDRWHQLLRKHGIDDTVVSPVTRFPQVRITFSGMLTTSSSFFARASLLSVCGWVAARLELQITDIRLQGKYGSHYLPLDDYTTRIGELQLDSILVCSLGKSDVGD